MVQQIVKPLEDQLAAIEEKLEVLQETSNDNEQYSRRYNIRIYGVDQPAFDEENEDNVALQANENCAKTVIDLCTQELGIMVERNEIDRAHRIGRPNQDGQRALIVKFHGHESKRKVMRAKWRLKGKKVFINEDLTWL